jgi:hypothetical protein
MATRIDLIQCRPPKCTERGGRRPPAVDSAQHQPVGASFNTVAIVEYAVALIRPWSVSEVLSGVCLVRYVLSFGLIGVIVAFAIVYAFYFH